MEDRPDINSQKLDHLGLVAAICKKIDLVGRLDTLLPKTRGDVKVTNGEAVLAMIINGLGFRERRLYLTSHFYKDKASQKLFGDGFNPEALNDDVLGRTLDAIYEYGVSKLFTDIVFKTAMELDLVSTNMHVDTTSLSFSGKLKKPSKNDFEVTHGHSKDKRSDLPQAVLSMITGGESAIPFFTDVHSGNANDREVIPNVIGQFESIKSSLQINKDFVYVADSALYSKKYLLDSGHSFTWITRVPESLISSKAILERDKSEFEWTDVGNGFKVAPTSHAHKGIKQRWIMVYSRQAYYKEITTLERNLKKAEEFLFKRTIRLKNHQFHCEAEALTLRRNHPLFKFSHSIKKVPIRRNCGGKRKLTAKYQIYVRFLRNQERIKRLQNRKGRFILATNTTKDQMTSEDILRTYHGQAKVEGCFKFIKDRSFFVKDFYLKKPERIQALIFIMTLTLFVFSLGQHILRQALKSRNQSVPNQRGQEIQNPTLKWVFQLLQGVSWINMKLGGKVLQILTHLNDVQKTIINCFPEALSIYSTA